MVERRVRKKRTLIAKPLEVSVALRSCRSLESHSAVYGVSSLFLGAGRLRRRWSRGHLPLRGFDL
ncbi:MAG: hypothetical protein ABWZ17_07105, partial [Candidatus Binatia bacterium]